MDRNDSYQVPTGIVPRMTSSYLETQNAKVQTPPDIIDTLDISHKIGLTNWTSDTPLIVPYPETFSISPATNKIPEPKISRPEHNHYFKDVQHLKTIDVYRVIELFEVSDPCIQHAIKKLLVAGGRGAGKSLDKDVKEAIDSLKRYQEMRQEDCTHV